MVDTYVVEEGKDCDEIGLRGFYFNVFDKDKEEMVIEVLS